MKFFEDLTKNVTKVASQTVKKTEQLTEVAKLKVTLHMEEAKLSKCFEDIGRAYYDIKKNGEDKVSDIASLFIQADEINMTIHAIRTELAAANKSILCPRCKSEVTENSAFCSVCGLKVEKKANTYTSDACDCETESAETPCDCTCEAECDCEADCTCESEASCECETTCECDFNCDCEEAECTSDECNCEAECDCGCESDEGDCDCHCDCDCGCESDTNDAE